MSVPHDTHQERVILSGLLKEFGWLMPLIKGITTASFYHWHHGLVFQRLVAVRGGIGDLYSLLRSKKEDREWREPSLAQWLGALWEVDPTGCNCEYAAKIVQEEEQARRFLHVTNEILADARSRWAKTSDLIMEAKRKLDTI